MKYTNLTTSLNLEPHFISRDMYDVLLCVIKPDDLADPVRVMMISILKLL